MRCLVTGAAGFIGSHLSERLLAEGHDVVGVDAFIPYYPRHAKEDNLRSLRATPGFTFHELDLRTDELDGLVAGVDAIIHLAAMPGLVRSWSDFNLYMTCNLEATHRLLEAARGARIQHFIHGSTSSVYGKFATGDENLPVAPVSPYGVTKLSAEHLCQAYERNFGLPLTILRFFSVYGPRQRPDMAYHIFLRAMLRGEPITVFGDGEQSRSNTYVADCAQGVLLALQQPERSIGETFNLGGGEVVTLNQVIALLAELTGEEPRIIRAEARTGDQRSTAADVSKMRRLLGYAPSTSVRDGLAAQLAWQREIYTRERQTVELIEAAR
ncbi:MAG TPA: NAD-dependent epimerase/dehydratase family protein [Ktedonobacterales bacterium]